MSDGSVPTEYPDTLCALPLYFLESVLPVMATVTAFGVIVNLPVVCVPNV